MVCHGVRGAKTDVTRFRLDEAKSFLEHIKHSFSLNFSKIECSEIFSMHIFFEPISIGCLTNFFYIEGKEGAKTSFLLIIIFRWTWIWIRILKSWICRYWNDYGNCHLWLDQLVVLEVEKICDLFRLPKRRCLNWSLLGAFFVNDCSKLKYMKDSKVFCSYSTHKYLVLHRVQNVCHEFHPDFSC